MQMLLKIQMQLAARVHFLAVIFGSRLLPKRCDYLFTSSPSFMVVDFCFQVISDKVQLVKMPHVKVAFKIAE